MKTRTPAITFFTRRLNMTLNLLDLAFKRNVLDYATCTLKSLLDQKLTALLIHPELMKSPTVTYF
jgi:hypothetical protein